MSKSIKKLMEKEAYQAKVNNKNKTAYQPKPSRNFVILSGKDKASKRQSVKAETRRLVTNW